MNGHFRILKNNSTIDECVCWRGNETFYWWCTFCFSDRCYSCPVDLMGAFSICYFIVGIFLQICTLSEARIFVKLDRRRYPTTSGWRPNRPMAFSHVGSLISKNHMRYKYQQVGILKCAHPHFVTHAGVVIAYRSPNPISTSNITSPGNYARWNWLILYRVC